MRAIRRWRVFGIAVAVLLALVVPSATPSAQAKSVASLSDLKVQAIYYQKIGDTADRDLTVNAIAGQSAPEGDLWKGFFAHWDELNSSLKINATVPTDLPDSGHVFVILGASLSSSGGIPTQLKRRLTVGLAALAAYPNSKVLVTGGKAKNGITEGQAMHDYLVAQGIAPERILVETKAASTVGNATGSLAILKADPQYTSYTLISDASHIRRASVLFDAAAVQLQEKAGATWDIKRLSNVAYVDKVMTNPPSVATTTEIAKEVASLLGLGTSYSAVVSSPPSQAVLTGLKVTAPTQTTYQVGAALNPAGLVATALYNGGTQARTLTTDAVVLSGFTSAKVGTPKVTASYTESGVTATASFAVKVTKASSRTGLGLKSAKVKKNKTKLKVTVTVTAATGTKVTGTVRFYLGTKKLKTVSLKSAKAGFTYPKFTRTGTKTVKVSYVGSSTVAGSSASAKVSVKKR